MLMTSLAPQLVRLTPEEKRLYGQLFRIADSAQVGVITGAVAVEFFKKSRLTPATLAEVISPFPVIPKANHHT
jgi:epidermal growth factor receptor substrate 15